MDLREEKIITERLLLIALSEKYLELIFKEFTPEITTYMFPASPKEIFETKAYIDSMQPKLISGEEFPVVILNKETGEFLGGGGVHKLNTQTPELGIWIKKSAHGNKYGQEAVAGLKKWIDDTITYNYIIYPVAKENIASRKIAESLGGIIEATYEKLNRSGKILDEVEYRIYPKY